MSENRRGEITIDNKLFSLLKLNPERKQDKARFDAKAVLKEVRRNPQAVTVKYKFTLYGHYYPLHQTIWLGADIDTVETIYNSYPQAIQEKCVGLTALRIAVTHSAPTAVVLFLISKWPKGVRDKYCGGNTPLHRLCYHDASYEVVSSLLNVWPGAAMEKNHRDETPFHCALQSRCPPLETLSLLLDYNAAALREKNAYKRTPLHHVCRPSVPLHVILFLLEKWPEATIEKDAVGVTPYVLYGSKGRRRNYEVSKVLFSLSQLYSGDNLMKSELRDMMDFFVQIEWWHGVLFILDQHPTGFLKDLDVDFRLLPKLFYIIGQRCKMKTLWEVVSNELDIMEGV